MTSAASISLSATRWVRNRAVGTKCCSTSFATPTPWPALIICHQITDNLIFGPRQARPGHMYRKFSWGNKRSLWDTPREAGVEVRGEILKYYE